MGLFKKLTNNVSNIFKKAGGATDNFFKKAGDDITKASNTVGNGLAVAGNKVGGAMNKLGNSLEKAAPILGDVGAGVAVLAGQPELAPGFIAMGNSASAIGGSVKRTGGNISSSGQLAQTALANKTGGITAGLNSMNRQLQDANRSVINRVDLAGNTNQLAAIHAANI